MDGSGLAGRGLEHDFRGGHGACVRSCRLAAQFSGAAPKKDDRLPGGGLLQRLEELATVADALKVRQDDSGLRVVPKIVEQMGSLEEGFVTQADKLADAGRVLLSSVHQHHTHTSGLREKAGRAHVGL